jgi:hypothetical protein
VIAGLRVRWAVVAGTDIVGRRLGLAVGVGLPGLDLAAGNRAVQTGIEALVGWLERVGCTVEDYSGYSAGPGGTGGKAASDWNEATMPWSTFRLAYKLIDSWTVVLAPS